MRLQKTAFKLNLLLLQMTGIVVVGYYSRLHTFHSIEIFKTQ